MRDIMESLGNVQGAVFCHGKTLYNPYNRDITPDVEIHENVHSLQQKDKPELWWKYYLNSPAFRLDQEIEAYGTQYFFIKQHMHGKLLEWGKEKMAQALSGEKYGNLISFQEAESKIRNFAKNL